MKSILLNGTWNLYYYNQKEHNIEHYYNTNVSSTACFIAKKAEEFLDKKDLELAVLATMIDTVSFHSTKGRKELYQNHY